MTELVDRSEEERKKALKREQKNKRAREQRQRPDVKAQRRAYAKDYYRRNQAQLRARDKAYREREDVKARTRARKQAYDAREEYKARVRERRLLAEFGITQAQYDLMLKMQGGGCVLCGRPPKKLRLSVEHDHVTGRVRGLACFRCNKYVIGQNTVALARRLVEYLASDFDGRKLVA